MRSVKAQYFLTYAFQGCVLPYIAVYFKQEGLNETQIGYVLAAASLAVVLAPVLVTLLADTRIDARRVMAGLFVLSAATLLAMHWAVAGFAFILVVWCAHNFVYMPITPLQDGINFSIQRRRHELGYHTVPYHRIRIWGTVGYMVGGFVLFGLLRAGFSVDAILISGAICCAVGAGNAILLPDPQIRKRPDPATAMSASARIPTFAAAATLLRRPILVFCIATFMVNMALAAYSTFYPLYLNETLGIGKQWLAPIMNIGVFVEICFMLYFGRLSRLLGLRMLMIICVVAIAVRLWVLYEFPTAASGIASQLLHGLTVIAVGLIPPVFINQHAEDRWRNSMQGIYTMLILGVARIAGNLAAGPIARRSLTEVFGWAAALTCFAAIIVVFAFYEPQRSADAPRRHGDTEAQRRVEPERVE